MITSTSLVIFYLISIIVVAAVPAVIEVFKELKQWKAAYDERKRIERFVKEFDGAMSNMGMLKDID